MHAPLLQWLHNPDRGAGSCYFQANRRSWWRRLGLQSMSMNEFLLTPAPTSFKTLLKSHPENNNNNHKKLCKAHCWVVILILLINCQFWVLGEGNQNQRTNSSGYFQPPQRTSGCMKEPPMVLWVVIWMLSKNWQPQPYVYIYIYMDSELDIWFWELCLWTLRMPSPQ